MKDRIPLPAQFLFFVFLLIFWLAQKKYQPRALNPEAGIYTTITGLDGDAERRVKIAPRPARVSYCGVMNYDFFCEIGTWIRLI